MSFNEKIWDANLKLEDLQDKSKQLKLKNMMRQHQWGPFYAEKKETESNMRTKLLGES